jgi:hypothetical protein
MPYPYEVGFDRRGVSRVREQAPWLFATVVAIWVFIVAALVLRGGLRRDAFFAAGAYLVLGGSALARRGRAVGPRMLFLGAGTILGVIFTLSLIGIHRWR